MAQMPSKNMPTIQMPKPMTTIASSAPSTPTITAQISAYQNVRIAQLKCDSSQVPRASPR